MKQYIKLFVISPDHCKQSIEAAVNVIVIIGIDRTSSIFSSLWPPKGIPLYRWGKLCSERLSDLLKVLLLRIGSTGHWHPATLKHWSYPHGNNSCGSEWEGQALSVSSVQLHVHTGTLTVVTWCLECLRPCSKSYFPSSSDLMAKKSCALMGYDWVSVRP